VIHKFTFYFQKTLGIITLEDIIEEMIQEDIYDESDLSRLQKKVQNRLNKMFKGKQHRGLPRQKSHDPTGRNVVSLFLSVCKRFAPVWVLSHFPTVGLFFRGSQCFLCRHYL
jgi:hypothetical protein